jgi:hypothetical protein
MKLHKTNETEPDEVNLSQDNRLIPSLKTALRVSSIRDASRLMARVVYEFQRLNISSENAKTLAYLLQCYINSFRMAEIEDEVLKLEQAQERTKR